MKNILEYKIKIKYTRISKVKYFLSYSFAVSQGRGGALSFPGVKRCSKDSEVE